MLKNKSSKAVDLKWDGKVITVPPGGTADCAIIWQIPPREVVPLEGVFLSKHPGDLERVEKPADVLPPGITGGTGAQQEEQFEEEGAAATKQQQPPPPEAKKLEEMTNQELMEYLTENDILEGWNGKTVKAELLKMAQEVRAKKG